MNIAACGILLTYITISLLDMYHDPRYIAINTYISVGLLAFFAGIALVLLTPIRHVALIEPTIDDIDPQQFYAAFIKAPEKFVFIDVRPKEVYNKVHATGSLSVPLHTLYDEWRNLPRNSGKTVVLICGGGRASGVGYHYLEHHGFFNLRRIEGGIEAWQIAGLPVEVQN